VIRTEAMSSAAYQTLGNEVLMKTLRGARRGAVSTPPTDFTPLLLSVLKIIGLDRGPELSDLSNDKTLVAFILLQCTSQNRKRLRWVECKVADVLSIYKGKNRDVSQERVCGRVRVDAPGDCVSALLDCKIRTAISGCLDPPGRAHHARAIGRGCVLAISNRLI